MIKFSTIVLIAFLAACVGAGFYLYLNEIIIIWHGSPRLTGVSTSTTSTVRARLYQLQDDNWRYDYQEILAHDGQPDAGHLVQQWFDRMYEEKHISHKIAVMFAQMNASQSMLFIQVDRSPFAKQASIASNIILMKGLLKTLSANKVPVRSIQLLLNNEPLERAHLSFATPWPTCWADA